MQRFAILESNSGYVWGIVDAESALAACTACDEQAGGNRLPVDGHYESASVSDLQTTRGVYDVRIAPADFDIVDDPQSKAAIAAVEALPRAGIYCWVSASVIEDDDIVFEPGDRVEGGEGEDYDTGRIESVDGDTAVVAWDSGVKTPASVYRLTLI